MESARPPAAIEHYQKGIVAAAISAAKSSFDQSLRRNVLSGNRLRLVARKRREKSGAGRKPGADRRAAGQTEKRD
jgi:hypothetical protein